MQTAATAPPPELATLIGADPTIVAIREQAGRLAASAAPILVTGPAGCGKATVARLIHQRGPRAAQPFVAIDWAGASQITAPHKIGRAAGAAVAGVTSGCAVDWDQAGGGTLFLAGIDAMPAAEQAALLRRLTDGAMDSGRIVAATAVNLAEAAAAGRFNAALLDRITAIEIAVPPLVTRPGDIPLLIGHFAACTAAAHRPRFDAHALAWLRAQPWPDNVRGLRNFVARAAAILPGATIDDARSAVLLYGERRAVDRWLASASEPLPLPNRRRPPPLVAADEVTDLRALLNDFEQDCLRAAFAA